MDELTIKELSSCASTRDVVDVVEMEIRKTKNSYNIKFIKDALVKASNLAKTFDDYRTLYLFSSFSIYPKIWPDFKWVDSLMEAALNFCTNDKQFMVLYKDAALMGKSGITDKLRVMLEAA